MDSLKQLAFKQGYDPRYYIIEDSQQQIPYLHFGTSGKIDDIKILMQDKTIKDLPDVSEIVEAIVYSKRNKIDKLVYYPKEILR